MTTTSRMNLRAALRVLRRGSVFLILLLIVVLLALLTQRFLTAGNLLTVALQTSMTAIVAIGMTFTIITGGIDLSVGSVAALSGALAAGFATRSGIGTYPALLLGLLVGAACGAVNGALIVWGRLPPFVATLAMLAMARGATLVYTQGKPISGLENAFTFWGSGQVIGIPVPVLILIAVGLVTAFVLKSTRFGVYVFAIGGGEETARLSGVPAAGVKFGVYVVSGLLAGLTGLLLTGRLWSAQPNTGVGLELDAIAAAVLGGASLAGGVGGIGGTIAGAFIIGVLSNGLNLLAVPSYNQQVVRGLVFIVAVLLDYLLKRRGQGGLEEAKREPVK
ncbi:MAG TPA: ABC transporter permease [Anaerolineaceae bacterium]|nr:ABC transporter permease [Anaerolineaceae bacterium]